MTATTVRPTTRTTIVSEINDILDRSMDSRTVDEYVWRVRAFLTMNNYELWPDEDIAALVKETVDPDWLQIEKEKPKRKPAPGPTESTAELPELIPFSKLPGYLLDPWGIPHRQGGQGRKPGRVVPENVLFHRKGRKGLQHSARYTLTIDRERRRFSPKYLLRARLHAEAEHRQKLPLSDCKLPEVDPALAGET